MKINQVSSVNEKQSGNHSKKLKDESNREQITLEIINLVNVLKIKTLEGWEDIPFTKIKTLGNRTDLLTKELEVLLNELDKIFEDKRFNNQIPISINQPGEVQFNSNDKEIKNKKMSVPISHHDELEDKEFSVPISQHDKLEDWQVSLPEYARELIDDWEQLSSRELESEVSDLRASIKNTSIKDELDEYLGMLEDLRIEEEEEDFDLLDILEKYKDGRVKGIETEEKRAIDETWRKLIPASLKQFIHDWNTLDMLTLYEEAKLHMGKDRGNIIPFLAEISQIIFEEDDEQEANMEEEFTDTLSDTIMSLVEMVILPHLEVMDIIEKRGGNVLFSNLWNKPFTDKLKTQIKERDNYRCVICEGETDLHIHHKIPRDKGGLHHPANLVTLCASCHGVIETADVNKAFIKCLTNYKKNKYQQMKPQVLTVDKRLLQDEVEKSLDHILYQLNQKDEHKLMEEVMEIARKLEIIFYD
ncbi:HNH endonuclease [Gottfriedia solisilvae]|uniref:HNH endonuclease n=1 Tax=Gottfriedia solisilvae TaxID=1516104 RepID=UPI003D2F1FA0